MSIRAQQKQQRYQSIIATAKELFLERGVENIQMQDIATAAEIGIATLFRYFPKKEFLVVATTNALTDEMATDIGQIVAQRLTAYEKIEGILNYYMKTMEDPKLRLPKFFESFDLYDKIAEEIPTQYEAYLAARSKLADILLTLSAQGERDGSLRPGVDLNLFVMTMVQNYSFYTYRSSLVAHEGNLSEILSVDKQLHMMKDVFLRYIKP